MSALTLAVIALAPAFGSFAALVADRLPRGEIIVAGRSRCDSCGAPLPARDLAPLLSWALLRGRARCCGAPIPAALPGMELAALAAALWAALVAPAALVPATAALGWALLTLARIDMRAMILPDALTLPLLLAGLGLSALGATGPPAGHALAAALGYAMLAGIARAYRRWRGIEGLGGGDAKLLAAAGAWVGLSGVASVMLIACLAGLAHAGFGALAGRPTGWREPTPFGPALALGLWLVWLYGPVI